MEFVPVTQHWQQAVRHLSRDKKLERIIRAVPGEMLTNRGEPFVTLARAIVGQQISLKAADSIWAKLNKATKRITPGHILKADEETLRSAGLSRSKVEYMRSLAEFFATRRSLARKLPLLPDEEVLQTLTSIRGIGKWTAEMFLIFHLERPDVLPVDDLGLRKGVELHYNNGAKLTPKEIVRIAEPWRPWRSVATWYLWRALDPVPVTY